MVTGRIERLRALINHPRTGDDERAAARRMLDRIEPTHHPRAADPSDGNRRIGRHADLASIAEAVRADIAFARRCSAPEGTAELAEHSPLRDAPAQITYSVDTPFDGSIVVTVDDIPQEWGWIHQDGIETVGAALRALADELTSIMNSYNDTGTRFFGSVRIRETTLIR